MRIPYLSVGKVISVLAIELVGNCSSGSGYLVSEVCVSHPSEWVNFLFAAYPFSAEELDNSSDDPHPLPPLHSVRSVDSELDSA